MLWIGALDEPLLASAEQGLLRQRDELAKQVKRDVADPRSASGHQLRRSVALLEPGKPHPGCETLRL